jgi:hypothetical protein
MGRKPPRDIIFLYQQRPASEPLRARVATFGGNEMSMSTSSPIEFKEYV